MSTHCGNSSSESLMNHYQYYKRCTICTSCYFLVHGGCCKILGIWNNILLSEPFWKLVFVLLWWFPTSYSSLWPAVFLGVSILATLVTSHIWLERLPFYRATNISTVGDIELSLLQSLVDWMINGHSTCLQKWRLFLRLLLAVSRFSPLWINKISVFTCSLLYKGLKGGYLLWWYGIHVSHMNFLDKLCNLIVILSCPSM